MKFLNYILSLILFVGATASPGYAQVIEGKSARNITVVKNYIRDGDGEAYTSGFSTYADAAGTSPVDGTGGSPSSTYAISTNTSLRGAKNFLWTHSAANRQGEGFSYNFTIDPSDKGKVLQLSLEYLISSGTYADDDLQFWVYYIDGGNSKLIPLAPYNLKNSGIVEKFAMEFQTEGGASATTTYRLIGHVATTTATAYTIRFDNWNLGPQAKLYGSAVTDWVAYTPTNGAWTANTTYTGFWRRVGDSMELEIQARTTGAPTSANFTIKIPTGYTIDMTKMPSTLTSYQNIGTASIQAAGTSYGGAIVGFTDTSTLDVWSLNAAAGSTHAYTPVTQAVPNTFANGDWVVVYAKVPIVGWSSSQVMSSDADTRVIGFRANNSATTITGSAAKIVWTNTDRDDVGGYSSGTYTVKVPGWYDVDSSLYMAATPSVDHTMQIFIYRNGSAIKGFLHRYKVAAATSTGISVRDRFYFNAGDTIEIYALNESASPSITSSGTFNTVAITKVSGPAQIAASESVNGRYTNTAGTAVATSITNLPYPTKDFDSHNIYNTSTGIGTIPISGKYQFNAKFITAAVTLSTTQAISVYIYKNGAVIDRAVMVGNGASNAYQVYTSAILSFLAGDTFEIRTVSGVATTVLTTVPELNSLSWARVGNY